MIKAAFAASLVVLAGACASAPAEKATHYWESDTASSNRYRVDEQACQQQASGDSAQFPSFDAGSESYETYRECMVSRGYVLRNY